MCARVCVKESGRQTGEVCGHVSQWQMGKISVREALP